MIKADKRTVFRANHGFKSPFVSFLLGGYQFNNLKFLQPTKLCQPAAGPDSTTLDYQGKVVLPRAPGKLTFTGATVARRVGGHELYVVRID
jgi:hypothetical protein